MNFPQYKYEAEGKKADVFFIGYFPVTAGRNHEVQRQLSVLGAGHEVKVNKAEPHGLLQPLPLLRLQPWVSWGWGRSRQALLLESLLEPYALYIFVAVLLFMSEVSGRVYLVLIIPPVLGVADISKAYKTDIKHSLAIQWLNQRM